MPIHPPEQVISLVDALLILPEVESCINDLAEYNKSVYEHSLRVAYYSVMLGMENAYDDDIIVALAKGALLHDVGKVIVPNSILDKETSLNHDEHECLKQHVGHAAELLDFDDLYHVRDIVLYHHGYQRNPYPFDLSQDDSVLNGSVELVQIVALADQYDALSVARSYKPALEEAEVFEILGNHFTGDEKFVDQLFDMTV